MVIDYPLPHWRPDAADINNPGLKVAHNCIPTIGNASGTVTYLPIPAASLYSNSTLNGRPKGIMSGKDQFGTNFTFMGTNTAIYIFAPNEIWEDASRLGGYLSSDEYRWRSITFGTNIIATNYTDPLQYVNLNDGIFFQDLTELVRGQYITEHRGFTILGNTFDEFDGAKPNRLRWSALENPFDWSFSQATQADFQDLQNVGPITGLVSDTDVWVFCSDAIWRMHYVGTPWIFQFSKEVDRGCTIPNSLITVNGITYFYSGDGWYSFKSGQVTPIGVGKVDRWFDSNAYTQEFRRMTAISDTNEPVIYWNYQSKESPSDDVDTSLIYNYVTGEWTTSESRAVALYPSTSSYTSLGGLDLYGSIENVPASFDSNLWAGGNAIIWGLDVSGQVYTLTGPSLSARFETAEMNIASQQQNSRSDRTQIQGVRPVYQSNGTATVSIGSKQIPNENLTWSQNIPTNNVNGYAVTRNQARYHSIRCTISGAWDKFNALQIDLIPVGGR